MHPRWTETTKRMVVVIGVLLGGTLLYLGRGALISLLLAAVVAYALLPLVGVLHRRLRFPHPLATVVVYTLMLAVLATIPLILVPVITGQVRALNLNLVTLFTEGREWLRDTLLAWRTVPIGDGVLDLSALVDPALRALGEQGEMPLLPPPEQWLPDLFGHVSGLAFSVTSVTLTFFLILLYSFYMVKDGPSWGKRLDQLVPAAYRPEFDQLQLRLNGIWGAFFRGQLLFCLIMAIVTYIALSVLGIPGSIFLALLVGVLEIIPNLGPLIALGPIVLVAFIQGSSTIPLSNGWVALIVILVYALLQVLGANILAPIIIGGSVDLHPLVMLVGVVIGASVAGLIGAFLATPLLATLRVLTMYAYNKILDHDPFPEVVPPKRRGAGRSRRPKPSAQAPESPPPGEA